MSNYRLVIFDLDGTLIDSSEGIVHAVTDTIDVLGYNPLPVKLIRQCIGPPIADSIGSVVGYSQKQIDDFYKVFRPIYKEKYLMECKLYPDVVELLSALKKNDIKVAIATNKRIDYTTTLLKNLKLYQLFDCVEAMDMAGLSKKYQLIQNCIQKLKIRPDKAVMIGDSLNDYEAAIKAKVDFIGVRYGFGFSKNVHPSVRTVNSVRNLFDQLIKY